MLGLGLALSTLHWVLLRGAGPFAPPVGLSILLLLFTAMSRLIVADCLSSLARRKFKVLQRLPDGVLVFVALLLMVLAFDPTWEAALLFDAAIEARADHRTRKGFIAGWFRPQYRGLHHDPVTGLPIRSPLRCSGSGYEAREVNPYYPKMRELIGAQTESQIDPVLTQVPTRQEAARIVRDEDPKEVPDPLFLWLVDTLSKDSQTIPPDRWELLSDSPEKARLWVVRGSVGLVEIHEPLVEAAARIPRPWDTVLILEVVDLVSRRRLGRYNLRREEELDLQAKDGGTTWLTLEQGSSESG